jgi:hypothetical protein
VHRNETMDFTVYQGTWSQNGSQVSFAIRFLDSDEIETYKSTLNTDGLQFFDSYYLYQSQPESGNSNSAPATTPTPSIEPEVTENYNTIEQLEAIMSSSCSTFNAKGNKTLEGTLSFDIKTTTEIELFYNVSEWMYSDTEYLVDVVQEEILDYVIEDLNASELPEIVTVSISASYSISSIDNSWDNGGDLDGIVTDVPVENSPMVSEWISEDDLWQYGLSAYWAGEEIWIWESMNSDNKHTIYGSPASKFESGVEYSGTYNESSIRFRYNGGVEFYYSDLVGAGII